MRVAGVILAGGRSQRMGGTDKAWAQLAGRPLVERAAARLGAQLPHLAVNANGDPTRFQPLGLPVLADPLANYPGPLAGILAGLEWAQGICDAVVTIAVDTPFFPHDLAARLANAFAGRPVAAASGGRLHPVFALWPAGLASALCAFLAEEETRRVTAFLERTGFDTVDFPLLDTASRRFDPFMNINTPDELRLAEAAAGFLA